MAKIAFRPLVEDDLALLFNWMARPHVRKWYAPEPRSFMEVMAKYGPRVDPASPVRAYVIQVDGADAGYIQKYSLADFPDYRHLLGLDGEAGMAGMDLYIGDEWRTGHGLGSLVIRRFFLDEVLADPAVTGCVAGPHEGNAGSIRAFEKAGFHRWKVVENERGERECVMRRDRDTATYRIATIDMKDAATCVQMRRDMYRVSFGTEEGFEEGMGPDNSHYLEQLRARIAELPGGNVHLWRDGQIVGQLEMRILKDEPDVLYLSLIHLLQEHRGHGLGRKLHAHAMEEARRRGVRLMRLSVSQANSRAMLFYRRLGWVVVGTRPNVKPMAVMEIPVVA